MHIEREKVTKISGYSIFCLLVIYAVVTVEGSVTIRTVVYLIQVLLLSAYGFEPKALLQFFNKLTPEKVKVFLRKIEQYLLENYAKVYGFAALAIFVYIFIGVYFYASLGFGLINEFSISIQNLLFIPVMPLVYVLFFLKDRFNKKIWQLSKVNHDLLPFAINWFVVRRYRIARIGFFLTLPLNILLFPFVFLLVAPLFEIAPYPTIIILCIMAFLGICCVAVGFMLILKVSNTEVIIQILEYLKSLQRDKKKTKVHHSILSRAVDYCQQIVADDLYLTKGVDVDKYFEILYLARIWGDDSEKQVASAKIDNLISALENGSHRKFFEIFSSLDKDSKLNKLQKLRTSIGITSFLRKKKPRMTLGYFYKVIAIASAFFTIINVVYHIILPYI